MARPGVGVAWSACCGRACPPGRALGGACGLTRRRPGSRAPEGRASSLETETRFANTWGNVYNGTALEAIPWYITGGWMDWRVPETPLSRDALRAAQFRPARAPRRASSALPRRTLLRSVSGRALSRQFRAQAGQRDRGARVHHQLVFALAVPQPVAVHQRPRAARLRHAADPHGASRPAPAPALACMPWGIRSRRHPRLRACARVSMSRAHVPHPALLAA